MDNEVPDFTPPVDWAADDPATLQEIAHEEADLPEVDYASMILPQRETGYYKLKALRVRHYQICHLAISGMKNQQIADKLGVSYHLVCTTLNSPLAQDYMRSLLGETAQEAVDLRRKLQGLGDLAILVHEDILLNAQDDKVRLAAGKSVLEYVLEKAGTQVVHNHQLKVTADDLEAMRERAAQVRAPMLEEEHPEDIDFIDLTPERENGSPAS